MPIRAKIDSNETGFAFAEEVNGTPGVLPVTPIWYPLEPNEYNEFGGSYELLARRPINSSRQRKKGSITDLNASGGFNQDLTQENTQRLLQGFMYADFREKLSELPSAVTTTGYTLLDETLFAVGQLVFASGFASLANNGLKVVTSLDAASSEVRVAGLSAEGSPPADAKIQVVGVQATAGDLDVTVVGNFATVTSTTLDFTTLGLIPGEFVFVGGDSAATGFGTAANNGFKRVLSIATNALVFDKSALAMVDESSTSETVRMFFGRVLKNELGTLIKRRSYNLERQLGAPDTVLPSNIQAEYLIGSFGSEMTMNIDQADKINIDWSFIALDHQQATSVVGVKSGTRATIFEADAYNTSTDFSSLRMAIYNGVNEAPAPLFAHLLDLKLMIKNNVSVNKAVAVLGGFDVTLGVFEISAEITAYFSTVEAVASVRNNDDVTMHLCVAKENKGFATDIPLVALGDGRLDVQIDEPITLPLTMDASTAAKINPDLDYTILWCFFDYLPTVAEA